jgi:hypothetical protein
LQFQFVSAIKIKNYVCCCDEKNLIRFANKYSRSIITNIIMQRNLN